MSFSFNKKEEFPWYEVGLNFLIMISYLISAVFIFDHSSSKYYTALIWLPSGVATAAILLNSYKILPGIILGQFFSALSISSSFIYVIGTTTAATAEVILTYYILRNIIGFDNGLKRLKDVFGLIIIAAGSSTMISGLIAGFSICIGGLAEWDKFIQIFFGWWMSAAAGILTLVPLILVWSSKKEKHWPNRPEAEIWSLSASVLISGIIVFGTEIFRNTSILALSYIPLLFLFWSALRFGPRGTSAVNFFVIFIAVIGTVLKSGPFAKLVIQDHHLVLHTFIFIYAGSSLILSAMLSERKQTQEELRESEKRQKVFLNAIPDLVYRCSSDGIFLDMHVKRSKDLIAPREELIGKSIFDFLPEELALKTKFHVEVAMKARDTQFFEYEMTRAGMKYHEEARIIPSSSDEFFLVIRDISNRKETNTIIKKYVQELQNDKVKLKRNAIELANLNKKLSESQEKLSLINAQKDKFFSIIAHDLRSPFTALLGFTEYLTQYLDRLSKQEIRDYSNNIHSSAKNIYKLVENLLQWSRLQTNRIEFDPMPMNITALMNSTIELLRNNAKDKRIEIVNECQEKFKVFADMNMIETVIRNLISNAIKFTESGGKIIVDAFPRDGFIEVMITDSGKGIPSEDLPKLFRIDTHYSTEGTNREKGTGLGLILCKEFVQKNGGKIWVESKLGTGSTFRFTVPLATALKETADRNL